MKLPQLSVPVIPHDKALHFIYGVAVALVVLYAAILLGAPEGASKFFAFVAATAVGVVKEFGFDARMNKVSEVLDEPPRHTVSVWDAVATSLGGAVVWAA